MESQSYPPPSECVCVREAAEEKQIAEEGVCECVCVGGGVISVESELVLETFWPLPVQLTKLFGFRKLFTGSGPDDRNIIIT